MKPVVAGVVVALFADLASGQDRLPKEEVRRYAKVCVEQLGSLGDAQLGTEVEPNRACAVRGEGGGAMVIPAKRLTAAKLDKAERDVVPVGQVWLRKWTVVAGGKPIPSDKLRVVTVKVDDKDRPLPLLLLGLRKKGKDLELVLYAKDSEPLLTLPLKKVEFIQELPLELEWQRGVKNVDPLTLTLFGKYQAVLPITRQEQ